MKTKIITKPSRTMYGFEGMNNDAAKVLGYPWHHSKDTIIIDQNIHGKERARTKIHELVEKHYMDKGWTYWRAHKKASQAERTIK